MDRTGLAPPWITSRWTGNGPLHIVAGFVGSVTYSANTFTITPSTVIGDPLDFATLSPHCDLL